MKELFDPIPDFLGQWWDRNSFDIYLSMLVFFGVALGFVIGTAGRDKDNG
jgi:hypothetical protein